MPRDGAAEIAQHDGFADVLRVEAAQRDDDAADGDGNDADLRADDSGLIWLV